MADDQGPASPLEALQRAPGAAPFNLSAMLMGGPAQQSIDMLQNAQVIDPAAKWEAFAGAALRPATGGYGEAMGNALGALSEGRQKEAELRARYVPLIAQALIQRQLQAAQLAMNQWKLTQDFDKAGVGALTGLLNKPGPITGQDVMQALGGVVQRGLIPPEHAQALYRSLPVDDPDALRGQITRMTIGGLEGEKALNAVTPKVDVRSNGPQDVPFNVNPTAPQPVGPMGAPAMPMVKGLSPSERLGAVSADKDAAGNVIFNDKLLGTSAYANTPSAKLGVQGGAAGPGGAPPDTPPRKTIAGKEFEDVGGKKMGAYFEDLSQSLDAMRNVQQRLADMRELIKRYQPGASGELRLQLGAWVKDLGVSLGLSPEQADSLAQSLAKGDVGSAQAFNKLAVQGTLDVLKAANPRFTQAEFGVISKNNPNILNDPLAFDKMQNFITHQYQLKSAEAQEFDKYRRGGGDVLSWPTVWNQMAQDLGYIKPIQVRGAAKTSMGGSTNESVGVANNGRPMKLTDKGWVYVK